VASRRADALLDGSAIATLFATALSTYQYQPVQLAPDRS
jgi:hypothetical protein